MKTPISLVKHSAGQRKYYAFFGLITTLILVFTSSLQAAILTLNPTNDTMLTVGNTNNVDTYKNIGAGTLLGGSIYAPKGEFSLLRFDVSSQVPIDATINSVTLKLTAAYSYAYSHSETLNFWQISTNNAAWVEGTSVGVATNNGATGRYLNQTSFTSVSVHGGTNWASGGVFAKSAGDLGAVVGVTSMGSGVTKDVTYSFNLSNSLIYGWLADSNAQSAGLAFHMTNSEGDAPPASRFLYFYSMDSGKGSSMLPQLTIDYTPIPEPGTLGLIGFGGLLLWHLRRRSQRS